MQCIALNVPSSSRKSTGAPFAGSTQLSGRSMGCPSAGATEAICQPCTTSSACSQLTATAARKLQSLQMLPEGSAAAAMVCHGGQCVPEAAEKKDTFCNSLNSGAAALQVQLFRQLTSPLITSPICAYALHIHATCHKVLRAHVRVCSSPQIGCRDVYLALLHVH